MRGLRLQGAAALWLAFAVVARGQGFQDGDVYMVSSLLPDVGQGTNGLMRISPATWQKTVVAYGTQYSVGRGAYDPFRDRLIVPGMPAGDGLGMVDSTGTIEPIPYALPNDAEFPAPSTDGRIYFLRNLSTHVSFIDPDGATHDVYESDNTTFAQEFYASALWYDAADAWLFVAHSTGPDLVVERVTLNAAGDRVLARAGAQPIATSESARVVAISKGPSGSLMVAIDDSTNQASTRLQLLDPSSMTFGAYAAPSFIGAAGEIAGAFVTVANGALVLDPDNDTLRLFASGETGEGTIVVSSGVAGPGASTKVAQFMVVTKQSMHGSCPPDFNGDGFLDYFDFNDFIGCYEGGSCPPGKTADYDGDGFVDVFDFNAFVSGFEAGC